MHRKNLTVLLSNVIKVLGRVCTLDLSVHSQPRGRTYGTQVERLISGNCESIDRDVMTARNYRSDRGRIIRIGNGAVGRCIASAEAAISVRRSFVEAARYDSRCSDNLWATCYGSQEGCADSSVIYSLKLAGCRKFID